MITELIARAEVQDARKRDAVTMQTERHTPESSGTVIAELHQHRANTCPLLRFSRLPPSHVPHHLLSRRTGTVRNTRLYTSMRKVYRFLDHMRGWDYARVHLSLVRRIPAIRRAPR